jgi:hypothetical protein
VRRRPSADENIASPGTFWDGVKIRANKKSRRTDARILRQIAVADTDERRCKSLVGQRYPSGLTKQKVNPATTEELLFRAGLDNRALKRLKLKHGEYLEWLPVARG